MDKPKETPCRRCRACGRQFTRLTPGGPSIEEKLAALRMTHFQKYFGAR